MTQIKTASEIANMHVSGQMLGTVLAALRQHLEPGMTTKQLADFARSELAALGGSPAFLGYQGFPDVLCVSVNEQVVHGIPGARVISAGDIVSMDFGVVYNGMITDAAISVIAGKPSNQKHQQLVIDTERAMLAGVAAIAGPTKIGTIAAAVQAVLQKGGYGIVRDLVGHGVGHELHEDPNIPNYGRAGTGALLEPGMTIAIEPMATLGTDRVYVDSEDDWTILTADNTWSAHFEHTVLITETGAEILTLPSVK